MSKWNGKMTKRLLGEILGEECLITVQEKARLRICNKTKINIFYIFLSDFCQVLLILNALFIFYKIKIAS